MQSNIQPDPLLPFANTRTTSLRRAWGLFIKHVRPSRLIHEDEGVRGPLWFGADPSTGPLHIFANILRLLLAIMFAPMWMWLPARTTEFIKYLFGAVLWPGEWPQAPEAMILEPPGGLVLVPGEKKQGGEYAVTGYGFKPRWLLEVQFLGSKIVSQRQVRYESRESQEEAKVDRALKKRVQEAGYTAICYAMESAEYLFNETGGRLDPQPEISGDGNRKYNSRNQRKISQALLEEYARARLAGNRGKTDGVEFIWMEGFCLSDDAVASEAEAERQRNLEIGLAADIFRGARRVVVFCHVIDCDHAGVGCPWGNRLFALGEILNAEKVLRLTRTYASGENPNGLTSTIASRSGREFREDMQARAAEAKMWHLYNIMQHTTNSGGVSWQSAIHSLVVEALRRVEEDNFASHRLLGKALNGLLPRRSQLADLNGVNGWADLAWLLELNQGYYNAALLTSVCKLADPDVDGYRWWGKPIIPKEGRERLEPLSTAIPVKLRDELTNSTIPILSLTDAKTIELDHMLERDSAALERQPEMRSLRFWGLVTWWFLAILGFILSAAIGGAGILIYWAASVLYVSLQLMVGTIYVRKDKWIVIEDHKAPGRDAYRYLQSKDPSYTMAVEWGTRQLVPKWDVPHVMEPSLGPRQTVHPYPATLIDLRTGLIIRTLVTTRPNDMVVLAMHGNGVTCMLLDRDKDAQMVTISVKVGMANLPPYALAQSQPCGSVYVGGSPFREVIPPLPFFRWMYRMIIGESPEEVRKHLPAIRAQAAKVAAKELKEGLDDHGLQEISPDLGPALTETASIASTAPIARTHARGYRIDVNPFETTATTDPPSKHEPEPDLQESHAEVSDLPERPFRYRGRPNLQWFPERRGIENVV